MKLVLLFDHRFHRTRDGGIRSRTHYNGDLFQRRYLPVFDHVEIVARLEGGERGSFPLEEGVTLTSVGDWSTITEFFRHRARIGRLVRERMQGDVAVSMIAPGLLGNFASRELLRTRRPYGIEVVGDPVDAMAPGAVRHPLRPLMRWFLTARMARMCRHAAASTYVTNDTLQRRYPPGEKTVSRGCSSIELYHEAFADHPRIVHAKRMWKIVHVGTMSQPYKAQDVLIDALAVCRKRGLDIRLTLLGDGALRSGLEQQARQLNLADAITFAGHVPPGECVRQRLDEADLFVLPSRTEGLPRATLEAMARGLPCISTRVGGNPELLDEELLVPPGDAAALADKIFKVLGDPQWMTRLSHRNLTFAQDYRYEILSQRRREAYQHHRDVTAQWMYDQGDHNFVADRRAA